jgi:catechol 2,3-dioxygenase-like lactoylglutathione lyase family enzyme
VIFSFLSENIRKTVRTMSNTTPMQESTSDERRLLHFTLKITDRLAMKNFVCNILGMKVLRHEEMSSGCAAQCNGDYESPWSKTMAGYGHEHSFFALELNHNYDVQGYEYGNDFSSITIRHRQAVANARQFLDKKFIETDNKQSITVHSPDGHRFILIDEDVRPGDDPVQCLSLNASNLKKSIAYYSGLLKMKINEKESNDKHVKLYYGLTTNQESKVKSKSGFLLDKQCQLELIEISQPIKRGTGYGRKAFCCPTKDVELIQAMMEKAGHTILIPAMELGGLLDFNKAKIVILLDPDGNEVRLMKYILMFQKKEKFGILSKAFVLLHAILTIKIVFKRNLSCYQIENKYSKV